MRGVQPNKMTELEQSFSGSVPKRFFCRFEGALNRFALGKIESEPVYTASGSILPTKTEFKAPSNQKKIGVNIEFNINPDFFFDFRGFKSVCVGVRLNRNQYITPSKRIEKRTK